MDNSRHKFNAWDAEMKQMFAITHYCWMKNSTGDLPPYEFIEGYHLSGKDRGYHFKWKGSMVKRLTLLQYTGLKDKKDKEIYEGDIIKNNGFNFEVIFFNAAFIIKTDYIADEGMEFICGICCESEVIGTLHENPELLDY